MLMVILLLAAGLLGAFVISKSGGPSKGTCKTMCPLTKADCRTTFPLTKPECRSSYPCEGISKADCRSTYPCPGPTQTECRSSYPCPGPTQAECRRDYPCWEETAVPAMSPMYFNGTAYARTKSTFRGSATNNSRDLKLTLTFSTTKPDGLLFMVPYGPLTEKMSHADNGFLAVYLYQGKLQYYGMQGTEQVNGTLNNTDLSDGRDHVLSFAVVSASNQMQVKVDTGDVANKAYSGTFIFGSVNMYVGGVPSSTFFDSIPAAQKKGLFGCVRSIVDAFGTTLSAVDFIREDVGLTCDPPYLSATELRRLRYFI